MSTVLLDTNAYAAFKRGDADAVAILDAASRIAINSVVLGELLGGFAAGTREAENRRELDEFLSLPQVVVLPVGFATSERYGAAFARLRARGTPIPTNDLWIAASAIEHSLDLFSYDSHFRAVDGLRIGSKLEDFRVA